MIPGAWSWISWIQKIRALNKVIDHPAEQKSISWLEDPRNDGLCSVGVATRTVFWEKSFTGSETCLSLLDLGSSLSTTGNYQAPGEGIKTADMSDSIGS